MAKRKKNKMPQASKPEPKMTIAAPSGISAEEMQHIIARALVEADDIKEQQKREKEKAELKEWRSTMGYKEYSDKCRLWRSIKSFFNRLFCFVKLCYIPRKDIHGDRASFAIMKMFLEAFFTFAKWLLTLTAIVSVVYGIALFFIPESTVVLWTSNVGLIFFGFTLFLLSRMFRMASIEVEKIEDRNYLFGLFASVASIVSIIIAIIAVVKGG